MVSIFRYTDAPSSFCATLEENIHQDKAKVSDKKLRPTIIATSSVPALTVEPVHHSRSVRRTMTPIVITRGLIVGLLLKGSTGSTLVVTLLCSLICSSLNTTKPVLQRS